MKDKQIAVVGGGIAGLTAAIAFARKGARVAVIEQAPEFEAVGAGLQLSPNATRIFDRMGLLPAIEARWREIDHVALVSGRDLRRIARVPAGAFARRRWGAPYGVMLRSDLQDVLLDAARALPGCTIVTGRPISAESPERLRDEIARIVGSRAALIVGADGVWSKVRRVVPGHGQARFSGHVAWRLLAERRCIPPGLVDDRATTVFLGPAAHLVAYPLESAGLVNLVAVSRAGADSGPDANAAGRGEARKELSHALATWHPGLKALAASGRDAALWPLFEIDAGPWRHEADIVVIGDAAHAMMPFSAQGAAMAIEDAFELAETYAASGDLRGFEPARKARIARVRSRTEFNRFAYHARGPIRIGRDLVLALRPAESLASDLDWLYGYRAIGTGPR